MHEISSPAQMQIARQFRQTLSTYQQNRDLIAVGAYQRGSDPRVDNAVTLWPRMQKFLQQDIHERVDFAASLTALQSRPGGQWRRKNPPDRPRGQDHEARTKTRDGPERRRRSGATGAPRRSPSVSAECRERGETRRAAELPRELCSRVRDPRRVRHRRRWPRLPGLSRPPRRSDPATETDCNSHSRSTRRRDAELAGRRPTRRSSRQMVKRFQTEEACR